AKKGLERLLKIEICIERERVRMLAIGLHEKVDVAVYGIEILARRRTEETESPNMKATAERSQLFAMRCYFVDHIGFRILTLTRRRACVSEAAAGDPLILQTGRASAGPSPSSIVSGRAKSRSRGSPGPAAGRGLLALSHAGPSDNGSPRPHSAFAEA